MFIILFGPHYYGVLEDLLLSLQYSLGIKKRRLCPACKRPESLDNVIYPDNSGCQHCFDFTPTTGSTGVTLDNWDGDSSALEEAGKFGFEENPCPECGLFTLASNNGGLYKCISCGSVFDLDGMYDSVIEKPKRRSRRVKNDVQAEAMRRAGGRCVECGSESELQYDHIIPFSKGGGSQIENIQVLCQDCNLRKRNKIG